jgi:hypothetical protein
MGCITTRSTLLATITMAVMVSVGAGSASAAVLAKAIHPPRLGAPAHGRTNAVCSTRQDVNLRPGAGPTPSSGTFDTGGEKGSIICSGTFNGHRVTGPGSFGNEGTYTGICVLGGTSGRYFITVPTDAGPMHFAPTYSSAVAAVGLDDGSQPGIRWTGFEVFVFKRGDCVTAPVTKAIGSNTLIATDRNN